MLNLRSVLSFEGRAALPRCYHGATWFNFPAASPLAKATRKPVTWLPGFATVGGARPSGPAEHHQGFRAQLQLPPFRQGARAGVNRILAEQLFDA